MMGKLNTFALVGIDGVPWFHEVDAAGGLPNSVLVGRPEAAARDRYTPIDRSLYTPAYRPPPSCPVTIRAPPEPKKGPGPSDLPMALGLLVATGQLPPARL